jgi:thimet oligopeptidase
MEKASFCYPDWTLGPEEIAVLVEKRVTGPTVEMTTELLSMLERSSGINEADLLDVAITVHEAPFTKCNPAVSIKFLSMVSTSAEVREAALAARKRIREAKYAFLSNRELYTRLRAAVDGIEVWEDRSTKAKLEQVLARMAREGNFTLDKASIAQISECKTRIRDIECAWSKALAEETDAIRIMLTREQLRGCDDVFVDGLEDAGDGRLVVTLSYPHVFAIIKLCRVAETRREVFSAFVLRGGEDNADRLAEIAVLRKRVAQLTLGRDDASYTDYVLATKPRMARSEADVRAFLGDIAARAMDLRKREEADMVAFAREHLAEDVYIQTDPESGEAHLALSDFGYVETQMKKVRGELDIAAVKRYFPAEHVVAEIMKMYEELMSVRIDSVDVDRVENDGAPTPWADRVTFWTMTDVSNPLREVPLSTFSLDLYPRGGKYGHACVRILRTRCHSPKKANDTRRSGEWSAISDLAMVANLGDELSHGEVVTFAHEFGHLVRYSFCAAHGDSAFCKVPRDFVEAPSQMLENWCFEPEILQRISRHAETGERLPLELAKRIAAQRYYLGAAYIVGQATNALFDLAVHSSEGYPRTGQDVVQVENDARKACTGRSAPTEFCGKGRNFGHVAEAQYSGGYYGYLWAQVFSADMFYAVFRGKFLDPEAGQHYARTVLEPGGLVPATELLETFLGRKPSTDAFFRAHGLLT